MLRLIRAINAGRPLMPWQNPPDFTGRERTRLFASELDILRENQLDLDARLAGIIPAGVMWAWAGDEAAPPAGWLVCQGQGLSTGVYPTLHSAIGYSYGGSGTTFYLPDLRGRVMLGAGTGPGLTARVRGALVGAETVAITLAEMAAHSHTVNDHTHSGTTGDQDRSHWHGLEGHKHNYDHWHTANIANVKYMANTVNHNHGGGAGMAAEAPSPNDGFGGQVPVNVNGTGAGGTGGAGWHEGAQTGNTGHLHGFSTGWASNRGTDAQGSGQGHANMQPGVVIGGAIIKT